MQVSFHQLPIFVADARRCEELLKTCRQTSIGIAYRLRRRAYILRRKVRLIFVHGCLVYHPGGRHSLVGLAIPFGSSGRCYIV